MQEKRLRLVRKPPDYENEVVCPAGCATLHRIQDAVAGGWALKGEGYIEFRNARSLRSTIDD